MAYSELIKDYERIRDYMRSFFVYGFRSREEHDAKSARSYDNERRRIESWLGDCLCSRQDAGGKRVFLCVDSRAVSRNPLYRSFRTKSFTDRDITLHFYLLDLLSGGEALTVGEIVGRIETDYLSQFPADYPLDESTVRKKLREYEALGLLRSERTGRTVRYRLAQSAVRQETWLDAAAFFSEEAPVGVIGSFFLDRFAHTPDYFGFKHHYLLHALDSEPACALLTAMRERRTVELQVQSLRTGARMQRTVFPLRLYVSTQTGRQYLLGWHYRSRRMLFFRLDAVRRVTPGAPEPDAARFQDACARFQQHLWGVSAGSERGTAHIELTVRAGEDEAHIPRRLQRERRCGTVERISPDVWRFTADVYDAMEMLPWLRTFLGRIVSLECSDTRVTDAFYADLAEMAALYGGNDDAVQ